MSWGFPGNSPPVWLGGFETSSGASRRVIGSGFCRCYPLVTVSSHHCSRQSCLRAQLGYTGPRRSIYACMYNIYTCIYTYTYIKASPLPLASLATSSSVTGTTCKIGRPGRIGRTSRLLERIILRTRICNLEGLEGPSGNLGTPFGVIEGCLGTPRGTPGDQSWI